MALNTVILPIDRRTLFDEYILRPDTYPEWLVGADEIRSIDEGWPAPGTRFHHTVGIWPVHIHDYTESVALDPPHRFQMSVRATPFVRGLVTFTAHGDDEETILAQEEQPLYGILDPIIRPAMDPMIHLRNQASLRRLSNLVLQDHGTAR